MIGLAFVHTPQQAVVLMCVAAAGCDFGQGANWATIVDVGGAYAGTATGFVNMVGNIGNFLQPVIGAWVSGALRLARPARRLRRHVLRRRLHVAVHRPGPEVLPAGRKPFRRRDIIRVWFAARAAGPVDPRSRKRRTGGPLRVDQTESV